MQLTERLFIEPLATFEVVHSSPDESTIVVDHTGPDRAHRSHDSFGNPYRPKIDAEAIPLPDESTNDGEFI
ncbi:hypothetical protein [Streptomyces sp. SID13726]|uniref:hypothetical protein n=1 Tax=Streptomyces sp. SID13726 TaxID=2706058 RepID=UPI0013BD0367|nr:hypothetical protein [Streptomyces sp. SID13726]NEB05736.1 hypothetical protein [Streptomyces sp. SID13726]